MLWILCERSRNVGVTVDIGDIQQDYYKGF